MEEKTRIVKFVEEKFFKDGFHKTTMEELASELRMSKKTIYKHFPTKEYLVRAIAKHFMHNTKAMILPMLNSNKNAIEKLEGLIEILAKVSVKIGPKMLDDMRRHFPMLWNEIDSFRTELMFGNLTKVIDQGKKEGLFVEYPTPAIINMMVASLRAVVNPEFVLNNNFSLIEAASIAFKILIGGITTEKGKKIFNKTINKKRL